MSSILVWVLGAALAAAVAALLVLAVRVLAPLKKLTALTAQLETLTAAELARRAADIGGAPGETARALADFAAARERARAAVTPAAPDAGQEARRVAEEICDSLRPQAPGEEQQAVAFAGEVRQGAFRSCAFYDAFFPDEATFCFAVGQVPGNGIAEAMTAVAARSAIRERLCMGRSLVETMDEVNARLYALGGGRAVRAAVCLLSVADGSFSYVNAGGTVPYLCRSGARFEPLDAPECAPLGANERVSYRAETLALGRGDRLFFYTADLGEMTDRAGEAFGARELAAALNRSRGRAGSPAELLGCILDEAAAFCESGDDVLRSAAAALEYRRGGGDAAGLTVRSVPEDAPLVTEYLRRTLEDSGVPARDCARQLLLGDELFALCCRACRGAAEVRVECAAAPEENAFHLRVSAPMGGSDPLRAGENGAGGEAAGYIRAHTRQAVFTPGEVCDALDIVSDLT